MKRKNKTIKSYTYIAWKLFEGMKHVKSVEVYDPCSQSIVVSGKNRKSQGTQTTSNSKSQYYIPNSFYFSTQNKVTKTK